MGVEDNSQQHIEVVFVIIIIVYYLFIYVYHYLGVEDNSQQHMEVIYYYYYHLFYLCFAWEVVEDEVESEEVERLRALFIYLFIYLLFDR